ncbi:hypothetical protein [Comamonas thiooxydans]|uniref:hypothetical protein n=1 Tax=Comamonas thiooxydans TaxID=363952 RepID=UPI00068F4DFC|nr:hypothetical protein [Comamonas thiooxydans]
MELASLTIADLQGMRAIRPDLAAFADRLLVTSYEQFVKVLYQDLDACIRFMEDDPKVRQEDGEDRLTTEIIGQLKSRGYSATHDELVGGHSDIVVRYFDKYVWVAEAKIHSSYDYLGGGFDQLTTRYLRGTVNANEGALLIYIRNADVAAVVKNWSTKLAERDLPDFSQDACPARGELGFYNTYKHHSSGLPVRIRHMGINLHWDPKK